MPSVLATMCAGPSTEMVWTKLTTSPSCSIVQGQLCSGQSKLPGSDRSKPALRSALAGEPGVGAGHAVKCGQLSPAVDPEQIFVADPNAIGQNAAVSPRAVAGQLGRLRAFSVDRVPWMAAAGGSHARSSLQTTRVVASARRSVAPAKPSSCSRRNGIVQCPDARTLADC